MRLLESHLLHARAQAAPDAGQSLVQALEALAVHGKEAATVLLSFGAVGAEAKTRPQMLLHDRSPEQEQHQADLQVEECRKERPGRLHKPWPVGSHC
jgi:hypothetical protein